MHQDAVLGQLVEHLQRKRVLAILVVPKGDTVVLVVLEIEMRGDREEGVRARRLGKEQIFAFGVSVGVVQLRGVVLFFCSN